MSKERLIKKEAALNTVEFAYKACDGDIENFKELLIQCFEDLPEVEAIPIEWICEYIKKRPFALAYGMMEVWALGEEE